VKIVEGDCPRRRKQKHYLMHLETHTALGIPPTTFAEFARRNVGAFLGRSAEGRGA
jgi:hypothetical protein